MERYEQIDKKRKIIFFDNFIGGIAWGIGAIVGLTLIVAVLGFILKNVSLIPFVGNFVAGVIEFIINKNPGLLIR